MRRLEFQLEALDKHSLARAGRVRLPRGDVLTPVFMPVGTLATVRTQSFQNLRNSGSRILLANTWHLMQQPGLEVFRTLGGIHAFMGWEGLVLTDSGGYQVFSLGHQVQVKEEGALFRSHPDRPAQLLSPERSLEAQRAIGADVVMAFDHCVASTSDHQTAEAALERTTRWAERSLRAHEGSPQALFGIVQGACFPDLRARSAQALTALPFDGYAIGGLAVGETRAEREFFTALTTPMLPEDKPRYLMGVGTPIDLLEAVARGVDMFDCILPTAMAGRGEAWTAQGLIKLRRSAHALDTRPLEQDCPCPACTTATRAYLHHLIKAREILGWSLLASHNLTFYHRLMRQLRQALLEGHFSSLYAQLKPQLEAREEGSRPPPTPKPRRERPQALGQFQLAERSSGGLACIQHGPSGEIMHPQADPQEEAREVYVGQTQLLERLRQPGPPLVLWDVGLGAATNAMSAIQAAEGLVAKALRTSTHQDDALPSLPGALARALEVVSFERDLDALRLALMHPERFPHLKHAGPPGLLQEGVWRSKRAPIRWTLLEGELLERLEEAPLPDVIFYDPFSYKTDGPLWTLETFRVLREKLRGHACVGVTYSQATRVRAAMLGAGFWVAQGKGVGQKEASTLFMTPEAASTPCGDLLDRSFLERWLRSGQRYPVGLATSAQAEFELRLRAHPQWVGVPCPSL